MTAYPLIPAKYQYGPRKTTLGLMFHMAEGFNTVSYLATDPARGVSANFVCEGSGRMVQMMGLGIASGSLNPRDRSTDKAYYGHSHLVAVLGDWWTNPNTAVISVEIEGFRSAGPNARQVTSLIAWSADMVERYPGIRGALGHADQTDTKGCPGTSAAMRSIFDAIGGHGLWTHSEVEMLGYTLDPTKSHHGEVTVTIDGAAAIRLDDSALIPVHKDEVKEHGGFGKLDKPFGTGTGAQADRQSGWYLYGPRPAWLLAYAATENVQPPPVVDCDDAVAAELERAATRAHDAVLAQ